MHPSEAIRGRRSQLLSGRRIVLGISGSIAAVETPRIARELVRHGAEVRAVMSPEATRIVTEEALAFATGHRPIVQLTGAVEHVSLLGPGPERANLLLLAPATANTIAKIAHGIDDTVVTSCASVALGGGVPILLAPAMHAHMKANPAVHESLEKLRGWGVGLIEPESAEDEEKLASPETIAAAVLHRLADGPWSGRRVLVIGGASREPIDAVRSVTNESSGETSIALAVQAHHRGAEVELWAGAMERPIPGFLSVRRWRALSDLLKLLDRSAPQLRSVDAVFVPAALSDFTLRAAPGKIASRTNPKLRLDLARAPKLLPRLRRLVRPPAWTIGFKLEVGRTDAELRSAALAFRAEHGLDWVVANDRATMGSDRSDALIAGPQGRTHWVHGAKLEVAGKLLDDLGASLPPVGIPASGARGPAARSPRRAASSRRGTPSERRPRSV